MSMLSRDFVSPPPPLPAAAAGSAGAVPGESAPRVAAARMSVTPKNAKIRIGIFCETCRVLLIFSRSSFSIAVSSVVL